MNKVTKARKHNSSKLQELLDEVTSLEMEQTRNKMQLAARIDEFMRDKGWNKSQFAEKVGKNPSEITKWVSGTQNFTVDVLTEIASALGVEITALFGKQQVQVIYRKEIVVKSVGVPTAIKLTTPYEHGTGIFGTCFFTSQGVKSVYSQSYQA
ncbi:MAG: helix-turn-helix transcriptional regulator [Bacteroidales bacterium]|jgi:transcriptional regulator with XRE-family HTH domain|nr:helix-turn-helix transcriptional regulator [Bacteroidales bacterium]